MEGKKIVLHYFEGFNALGCIARLMLKYGNVEFENKTYVWDDWANHRGNFNFKYLPVLEVDGFQHSQSLAIYFYIAKKLGLAGSSDEQEQLVLSVLSTFSDIEKGGFDRYFEASESNSPEKIAEATAILSETITEIGEGYEKLYISSGSGKYFLGDKLSVADFFFAHWFGKYFANKIPQVIEVFSKAAPTLSKAILTYTNEDLFTNLFNSNVYLKDALI